MYDFCDLQNLDLDTLIHEEGAAQVEINFLHGNPLDLADQVFLFKRTVREVALRHDIYATFMSKPMGNEPGSAMHVHQSIVDPQTGANLFAGADGKASRLFRAYIGGLQKYIPAVMPIFAPNVNSYRRLARFSNAPINLQWGYDNRTCGLRVPVGDASAMRVENRVPGADANPYLAFAAHPRLRLSRHGRTTGSHARTDGLSLFRGIYPAAGTLPGAGGDGRFHRHARHSGRETRRRAGGSETAGIRNLSARHQFLGTGAFAVECLGRKQALFEKSAAKTSFMPGLEALALTLPQGPA